MRHRMVYTDGVTIGYCNLTSCGNRTSPSRFSCRDRFESRRAVRRLLFLLSLEDSPSALSVRTPAPSMHTLNSSVTGESEKCVFTRTNLESSQSNPVSDGGSPPFPLNLSLLACKTTNPNTRDDAASHQSILKIN